LPNGDGRKNISRLTPFDGRQPRSHFLWASRQPRPAPKVATFEILGGIEHWQLVHDSTRQHSPVRAILNEEGHEVLLQPL
jgi:hypothetical protein